jgi:YHS domain-containing protein
MIGIKCWPELRAGQEPATGKEKDMIQMGRTLILGFVLILTFIGLIAQTPVAKAQTVYNVDREGVAIKGYDPVGYFTMSEPVKGRKEYVTQYSGATWRFANAGNRDMFLKDPETYAPRYGGWCAYGVAVGALYDIDPDAWTVYEGRLYLNKNKRTRKIWLQDVPGNIQKADANWPGLQK